MPCDSQLRPASCGLTPRTTAALISFFEQQAAAPPPQASHQRASTSTATNASTPRDNSMELRPNNSISWLVCAAYHCATCIVVAADGSACCAKEAQRKKAAIAHLPHASIQQLNNSICPCSSLFGQLTWPLEPAVLVCSPTAAARVASLHYRGGVRNRSFAPHLAPKHHELRIAR
jgi:hypothetical protein